MNKKPHSDFSKECKMASQKDWKSMDKRVTKMDGRCEEEEDEMGGGMEMDEKDTMMMKECCNKKEVGLIIALIQGIGTDIVNVGESIGELEESITPILNAATCDDKGCEEKEDTSSSAVVKALQVIRKRLQSMNDNIKEINDRVEC